jgi:Putative addiction module component
MSVHLPLKDMTLKEKLEILEALWEDLARSARSVESPDWHKKTLEERGQRVAQGKARFTDWETAKTEIRGKLP